MHVTSSLSLNTVKHFFYTNVVDIFVVLSLKYLSLLEKCYTSYFLYFKSVIFSVNNIVNLFFVLYCTCTCVRRQKEIDVQCSLTQAIEMCHCELKMIKQFVCRFHQCYRVRVLCLIKIVVDMVGKINSHITLASFIPGKHL